jgi:hypothetical protein
MYHTLRCDSTISDKFNDPEHNRTHKIIIPNHEPTKHSLKRNGLVRAYAANTN